MRIRTMFAVGAALILSGSLAAQAQDDWFDRQWEQPHSKGKRPHAKGKQRQTVPVDLSQTMQAACAVGQVASYFVPGAGLACLPSQLEQLGQIGQQPAGNQPPSRTFVVHSYDKKTQKLVRREIQIATSEIREELRKEFKQELEQAIAGVQQNVIIVEEKRKTEPKAETAPVPKAAPPRAGAEPKASAPKTEGPPRTREVPMPKTFTDPNIQDAVLRAPADTALREKQITPVAIEATKVQVRDPVLAPASKRNRQRTEMKFLTD
jgi:hypothetical protein